MDDEAADIELLEQHLHKTSVISQRMKSILTKFDSRLVKLEKSILPLHNSTQKLTTLAENIESTLQSIDKVASNQEGIAAEEALILRGPRPTDLITYTDALERLNANIAFKGNDPQSKETAKLVETGAKKLCQLFTKIVAEASSATPIEPTTYLPSPPNQMPTIPPESYTTLQSLVESLRGLPLPSTHPSHPAASGILSTLKDGQSGYAEMRGQWGKKCLEPGSRQILGIVETADDGGGVDTGAEVGTWLESLLAVAEAEHETLTQLAPLPSTSNLQTTYASLISPFVLMVTTTLGTIQNLVKKNLRTHVFLAFGVYGRLTDLQPVWDDVIKYRSGKRENELADAIQSLRGLCLRSFPEFLLDIKMVGMPPAPGTKQVEVGTGIADITNATIRYLNQIPNVQDAVRSSLAALGDGNWKMGEGGVVKKVPTTGDDDQVLLEHYAHDVVQTLTTSLASLSKTHRRPALSSIFLLNNISHLRTKLILEPEAAIDDFISSPELQTHLNSQYRTAKASYYEANFTALLSALGDDRNKGKQVTKEKFATFFDALEEVAERHRFARVLGDDEDGRNGLADDVVRLVIPALQRFMQKTKDKEFSKNPQKYIKATPEEVEQQIRNFYR